MRLALFSIILLGISFAQAATPITLYPAKNTNMEAIDYKNRAQYLATYLNTPENGGAEFYYTNSSTSGPFRFRLELHLPSGSVTIYYLTLSSMMQTNVVQSGSRRLETIPPSYEWEIIQLIKDTAITSNLDFYYEISVGDLESKWVKTEDDTAITFRTIFKYFVNATELNHNILNVLIQCPVTLRRPKNVEGSYSNMQTTFLSSSGAGSVDIDLSISATLVPCLDSSPKDLTQCSPGTSDAVVLFALNDFGKFKLKLDNNDFAQIYYLTNYKVEMKSDTMTSAVDFTATAGFGPVSKGEMIFNLPMAIVGNPITVSATASISTKASRRVLEERRMQGTTVSKGTNAMYTFRINTNSDNSNTSGTQSTFIGVILLLGWLVLMI